MAQIALNVIVFALVIGVFYTARTSILAWRRKTRWRIHLIEWRTDKVIDWVCNPESGAPPTDLAKRSVLMWDTTLPPEIAIHHLPMVGTKWGDAIVESVGSEDLP